MSLLLNMVCLGSVGNIERQVNNSSADRTKIKIAVNGITAHLTSQAKLEGSVWTTCTQDDEPLWRDFCRGLRKKGFSDSELSEHITLIMVYFTQLGSRGVLDEPTAEEENDPTEDTNSTLDRGSANESVASPDDNERPEVGLHYNFDESLPDDESATEASESDHIPASHVYDISELGQSASVYYHQKSTESQVDIPERPTKTLSPYTSNGSDNVSDHAAHVLRMASPGEHPLEENTDQTSTPSQKPRIDLSATWNEGLGLWRQMTFTQYLIKPKDSNIIREHIHIVLEARQAHPIPIDHTRRPNSIQIVNVHVAAALTFNAENTPLANLSADWVRASCSPH